MITVHYRKLHILEACESKYHQKKFVDTNDKFTVNTEREVIEQLERWNCTPCFVYAIIRIENDYLPRNYSSLPNNCNITIKPGMTITIKT